MSENKRKRLSLKSKKSSVQSGSEEEGKSAKRNKFQNDQPPISEVNLKPRLGKIQEHEGSDDIICLSDDSDNYDNQSDLRSKTSRPRNEDGSKHDPTLLDVPDEQLRMLRIALLEFRRRQSVAPYIELPPNPVSEDHVKESRAMGVREATPESFLSQAEQEYSPLPQMCKACARRKPLCHDFSLIIKTVLSEKLEDKKSKTFSDRNAPPGKTINPVTKLDSPKNTALPKTDDNFVTNKREQEVINKKVSLSDRKTQSQNVEPPKMMKSRKPIPQAEEERPSCSKTVSSSADPKDSRLSACPLCTMEFEKGMSQMDIDSHIAACLSVAGDDVMW